MKSSLIKKISVVTALGAEIYEVGRNSIDKIFMDDVCITGDPHSHYCGYDKKGFLLFTISPCCPCVVDYLNDGDLK